MYQKGTYFSMYQKGEILPLFSLVFSILYSFYPFVKIRSIISQRELDWPRALPHKKADIPGSSLPGGH